MMGLSLMKVNIGSERGRWAVACFRSVYQSAIEGQTELSSSLWTPDYATAPRYKRPGLF